MHFTSNNRRITIAKIYNIETGFLHGEIMLKLGQCEVPGRNGGKEVNLTANKPRSRPTLSPEELMVKTIDIVSSLRLRGAPVSSVVITAWHKALLQLTIDSTKA